MNPLFPQRLWTAERVIVGQMNVDPMKEDTMTEDLAQER